MWYKPKEAKMGKYSAIKHKDSGELCLVGEYGEIWENNSTSYKAVICSSRIAAKAGLELGIAGDEYIIQFPLTELDKWVKLLKVRRNRSKMVERAECYGNGKRTRSD